MSIQPFVLVTTIWGPMIVNRLDMRLSGDDSILGVGAQILEHGFYEPWHGTRLCMLADARRQRYGDGVTVLDVGANLGGFTLPLAKHMEGWGVVLAFEPQDRLFYALAGTIALNNCFNVRAYCAAVGATNGQLPMPMVNYAAPGSYGSLELRKSDKNEPIGQKIDYDVTIPVAQVSLDHFKLPRVDLIKMDIEGMELEALMGAEKMLTEKRPILMMEFSKVDKNKMVNQLADLRYRWFELDKSNCIALHVEDGCLTDQQVLALCQESV